jgi:hypothetical protein
MPLPLTWSDPADTILRRLRAEGATWEEIAAAFGVSTSAVIGRGHRIGARPPPPAHRPAPPCKSREPLPAGHPVTWTALTDGTLLAGAEYGLDQDARADGVDRHAA